ncbi:unnamed protein product [Parajaminaea phylloscopi]
MEQVDMTAAAAHQEHVGESTQPSASAANDRPDAHTQRYDRQLRLWASSGQASLESAKVLLVGASHLGAQVLKNLILPGIGAFTVLDGQRVTRYDVGNNFFLEPESAGQPRAHEVARFLSELNPGVKSEAKEADPAELLSSHPEFFTSFSLIIAANQSPQVRRALGALAWQGRQGASIPLLCVRGAGMLGEVQAQVAELGIVETHPASTDDLRLISPWDELAAYASSYDVADRDAMAHSHIPFIVIILRVLDEWRRSHDSTLPNPAKDRKPFGDAINALRDPANLDTENFDEAIAALGQNLWRPISSGRKVPDDVEKLFHDPACQDVTIQSTNFWLLVRALRDFVAASATDVPSGGEGHLPLPGSLPDFKATSSTYVEIQKLYKGKAQKDLLAFRAYLHRTLTSVGLPVDAISEDEVSSFAKHAGYLKLIRGRSLEESRTHPAKDVASMAFMDPVNPSTIQNHLGLLAVDRFHDRFGRFPGSSASFSDSITGAGRSTSASGATRDSGMMQPSTSASSTATATATATVDRSRRPMTPSTPRPDGEPEKKRQKSESPYPPPTTATTTATSSSRPGTRATKMGGDVEGTEEQDQEMREATATLSPSKSSTDEAAAVDVDVDADEAACLHELQSVLDEWSIVEEEQVEAVQDAVKELVRSGHADLASTASLLGGITAQEAIKLITRQYVPISGVAVYDGIKQAIGTFNL